MLYIRPTLTPITSHIPSAFRLLPEIPPFTHANTRLNKGGTAARKHDTHTPSDSHAHTSTNNTHAHTPLNRDGVEARKRDTHTHTHTSTHTSTKMMPRRANTINTHKSHKHTSQDSAHNR